MHQVDGICFLVFAERGLWNRFVPSLDGYIQDRLNNPVHVPGYGTITLAAPAGTAFSTNGGNYLITDTTTSLSCSLNNTPFPSSNTVTLPVLAGCPSIAAGHGVRVVANDTANPSTSGPQTLAISTSSDGSFSSRR